MDLAELSAVCQLHGLLEIGDAAPLGPGLEHAPGALDRLGQLLAQGDGYPARLLTVDVLARLRRQHRRRGVPAVAGRDQDGVDVLAVEQLPEVAEHDAVLVSIVLVHHRLAGVAAARLHVGDGHAMHVGQFEHGAQIVGASWAEADDPERDLRAGRDLALSAQDPSRNEPRGRKRRARGDGATEEAATGHAGLLAHDCRLLSASFPVESGVGVGFGVSRRFYARVSPAATKKLGRPGAGVSS